jgi:hypothetical protein
VVLGITYENFVRREQCQEFASLILNPEILKDLSNQKVQELLSVGLGLAVDDEKLGSDMYTLIKSSFVNELKENLNIEIKLEKIANDNNYFLGYLNYKYRTRIDTETLKFTCYTDENNYQDAYKDKAIEWRWHNPNFQDTDLNAFDVSNLKVQNNPIEVKKNAEGRAEFSADIKGKPSKDFLFDIEYSIRIKIEKTGHFRIETRYPTKGITVKVSYPKDAITTLEVISMISCVNMHPTITPSETQNEKTISVSTQDQWVIPTSGFIFVYKTSDEGRES